MLARAPSRQTVPPPPSHADAYRRYIQSGEIEDFPYEVLVSVFDRMKQDAAKSSLVAIALGELYNYLVRAIIRSIPTSGTGLPNIQQLRREIVSDCLQDLINPGSSYGKDLRTNFVRRVQRVARKCYKKHRQAYTRVAALGSYLPQQQPVGPSVIIDLREDLQRTLRRFDVETRLIVLWRLAGFKEMDIADALGRHERTIIRRFKAFVEAMQ